MYLVIILKVMKDKKFLNQKSRHTKVAEAFAKLFNPDLIANLIIQFPKYHDASYTDEYMSISDQIMSLAVLILV